jgi:predicted unusual protein kinase regulating ubiquinone biosynthesis (AarF/ABC1/UbiB family)
MTNNIQRYAKVTKTFSGVAIRWIGSKYLGIKTNNDLYAQHLTKILGDLKGPLMKISQLLATIPGALPPKYTKQLMTLQSKAPPMGWIFVNRRMVMELGEKWEPYFRTFNRKADYAASLGQVHKAVTEDGDVVACKLQYPNMDSIIKSDLKQLKIFLKMYEKINKAIKTEEIYQEISERLIEELDYKIEAGNVQSYRRITSKLTNIHTPLIHKKLSTKLLLTMSWMEGQSLPSFIKDSPPIESRNKVARNLFWAWYFPFYSKYIIHGDPHLGNYTIRKDNGINILDFGCIRQFSKEFVTGVLELYKGLLHNNRNKCFQAYELWGFKEMSNEIFEILNIWAKFLYSPLLEDRIQTIDSYSRGIQGRQIAGDMLEKLHKAGGVSPPKEFVLMDRSAVGIGSALMHLKAKINWHREFEKLLHVSDFDSNNPA